MGKGKGTKAQYKAAFRKFLVVKRENPRMSDDQAWAIAYKHVGIPPKS